MRKCEIIGNLGRDPDMSYNPAGLAITKFSVACSDGIDKDNQGNRIDGTQWMNCTCFGKIAENANEYLKKGNKVFVRGKFTLRHYTTKDGKSGVSLDVLASEIEYLTPKDTQASEQGYQDTKNWEATPF